MPLVPYTSTPIRVRVSNRVINDTIIYQEAVFQSLIHRQEEGESKVIITVLVTPYSANGPDLGEALTGKGFQPYREDFSAANDTIVDATNGETLEINTNMLSKTAWTQVANSYTQPVMFQGDFFEMLRDNSSVEIGNLIRTHIMNADALGRFNG